MYDIEDTTAAIREAQRLLGINQSGIYDQITYNAVLQIQNEEGINKTGKIDYETFTAIIDRYHKKELETQNSDYLFNPDFPYSVGDIGDNVGLINDAIRLILKEYVYEGIAPKGNYLSDFTITAANFLRDIFKMGNSGVIDSSFINRLILEKRALEIKKKYS